MAVERIFAHFKADKPTSTSYDPGNPDSYEAYLHTMFEDAEDYEQSILAGDRSEAQLLYYGYSPSLDYTDVSGPYRGEDPNQTYGELLDENKNEGPSRSTFVSTDVRDAIMLTLPSLVRLFAATESPVFLVPRTQEQSDMAEQATDYVNYTFWNDNDGFLILYGALKDALTVRTGFVKWWSDNQREVRRKRFENITREQIQFLLSESPSANLVEIGKPIRQAPPPRLVPPTAPPPGLPPPSAAAGPGPGPLPGGSGGGMGPVAPAGPPNGPPPGPLALVPPAPPPGGPNGGGLPSLAGAPAMGGGLAGLVPPPPPIYAYAVVEYEVSKPLIKIAGVPPEEMRLDRYSRNFRNSRFVGHERIVPVDEMIALGYDREKCLEHVQSVEATSTVEPQLRNPGRFMGTQVGDGVKYGEWYVKIDKDGDGQPELRRICTMGQTREIVKDEEANRVRFALFSADPISHTTVGDSLADYTKDLQIIKTNMMRAILDSAAESINPKTVVNELMVTIDDAMGDDLGQVIRTRGDPNSSVMFANRPFLGQQILPLVEMLNDVLARRTGLTDAAKGLDPKALQSSTMLGVEAIINGAQERIELLARVLCETGFKDLFAGLFDEICENPNQQRVLKMRGKWVPYDTSTFDASLTCEVNANLGKGSDMVRMIALQAIDQKQQLIVQTYGLNNPICGIPQMLATQEDMLKLANVTNMSRYFLTPSPATIAQITSQPKQPDPMAMAAQAQQDKVRADAAKAASQQNLDIQKMQLENQYKHAALHAKTTTDLQRLDLEGKKFGVDITSQLQKSQQDADAADQDAQIKTAQAQQDMDLQQQQHQHEMGMAQQKAATEMQLAHMKTQSAHQIGMAKVQSAHQIGTAKADSAHDLGQQKVTSQHILGALAAENAGEDK